MTPDECVQRLKDEGIVAELKDGIPFIPAANVPTFADKLRALHAVRALGLQADIWAEGMMVRP